jgi:hypothetical protein
MSELNTMPVIIAGITGILIMCVLQWRSLSKEPRVAQKSDIFFYIREYLNYALAISYTIIGTYYLIKSIFTSDSGEFSLAFLAYGTALLLIFFYPIWESGVKIRYNIEFLIIYMMIIILLPLVIYSTLTEYNYNMLIFLKIIENTFPKIF